MSLPPSSPLSAALSARPPRSSSGKERTTLPPPEWEWEPPASAGRTALVSVANVLPVGRRTGPRADYFWYRAKVEAERTGGDAVGERWACVELSDWLWRHGVDLAEAIALGQRALELQEEAGLRRDLASRLVTVGRMADGAQLLQSLTEGGDGSQAAAVWVQVARLYAWAGHGHQAADALRKAMVCDGEDPLAPHLLGTLTSWSPETVSGNEASGAFLEAARRRLARGDKKGALEDKLRAFDVCPARADAAREVATAMASKGRGAAADCALRTHAYARNDRVGREALRETIRRALAQNEPALALGTVLDACLDVKGDLDDIALSQAVFARQGIPAAVIESLSSLALDDHTRAEILLRSASQIPGEAQAAWLAAAARTLQRAGHILRARETAVRASEADPGSGLALEALADAMDGVGGRMAFAAYERAAAVLVPRSSLYERLAELGEGLGETTLAFLWTQRWQALQPGDPRACAALLVRAAATGDLVRVRDVVVRLFTYAVPLAATSAALAHVLRTVPNTPVNDEPTLARIIADAGGMGGTPSLRQALEEAAAAGQDAQLNVDLRERYLATITEGPEQEVIALAYRLAELRHHQGDVFGHARALLRALGAGASRDEVAARLISMSLEENQSDADLTRLELLSQCLDGHERHREECAQTLRQLGAGLWDLAGDVRGALHAWLRAARLNPEHGFDKFLRDLCAFAGLTPGIEIVREIATEQLSTSDGSHLLVLGAALLLETGASAQAFVLAEMALGIDASRTEALAIAELTATQDVARLDRLYMAMADGAKGVFGRRAAHYRAARQLERRGQRLRAVRHAVLAFEALPSTGTTLALLTRLAEASGNTCEAVDVMQRVAEASSDTTERSFWFRRAALLTDGTDEALRRRVDLLLQALRAQADLPTLTELTESLIELIAHEEGDWEGARLRFVRATREALAKARGPQGARLALRFAQTALTLFNDAPLAIFAVTIALRTDASVEDFTVLLPDAERLTHDLADGAPSGILTTCGEVLRAPYGRLGEQAQQLAMAVAAAAERLASERQDYEAMAALLSQRIALMTDENNEERRVLRIRRAALLEQRLGRLDEAHDELELVLAQTPDDPSATRFLADVCDQLGQTTKAAALWAQALPGSVDLAESLALATRAVDAFLRAGDEESARRLVHELTERWGESEAIVTLRVGLERRAENRQGTADGLDALAVVSAESPEVQARRLVEAALALLEAGDHRAALEHAQSAARLFPTNTDAQLLAHRLAYQMHGPGNTPQATRTIEDLRNLTSLLLPEQIALQAFLLAEALDLVQGQGAGLRELSARHAEIGALPLIALGMAERLARGSNVHAALAFFEIALAGDIFQLRPRGTVTLAAADVALQLGDFERASRFLEQAAADPVTAVAAQRRLATLTDSKREHAQALVPAERSTLEAMAARSVGLERARALAKLAHVIAVHPSEQAEADRLLTEAITIAAIDPSLRIELEAARDALRGVLRPSLSALRAELRTSGGSATAPPPPFISSPASYPPSQLPLRTPIPTSAPSSSTIVWPSGEHQTRDYPIALAADSSIDYARRTLAKNPANREALLALRDLVHSDHDYAYALALDHVIAAFTPGAPPTSPPPLAAQREQAEHTQRLVRSGTGSRLSEALELVWLGAPHLFRRDMGTYGITGLDRVSFGAVSPVSRVYAGAVRLLGTTRTPLFHRRANGSAMATVALLVPAAVVLVGDTREETPELAFRLGASLLAAASDHALLFALPDGKMRAVVTALLAAFGSAQPDRSTLPNVASLAENFWQSLPARSQRRLRELCTEEAALDVELALYRAQRIVRRAGLLVAGDISVTVQELAREEGLGTTSPLDTLEALDIAGRSHPALADILSFAISPEYADARWQLAEPKTAWHTASNMVLPTSTRRLTLSSPMHRTVRTLHFAFTVSLIAWVGGPSCLVTSTAEFPQPPSTRPYLDAVSAEPSLFAVQRVDDLRSEIRFRVAVQSEDKNQPLEALLVADYPNRTVLGQTFLEPDTFFSTQKRVLEIHWVPQTATGFTLTPGCHAITLVVAHQFAPADVRPLQETDANLLVWWVLVADPSNPNATGKITIAEGCRTQISTFTP